MVTLIPTPEALGPNEASYGNMVGTKIVEAAPNEFRRNRTSLRPWTSRACLRIHAAWQNLPPAINVGGRDTAPRAETLEHRHPRTTAFDVPRTLALRVA